MSSATDSADFSTGQEALRRGEWQEARRAFERALVRRNSAEAFEGLSWAAWWLNDGDLVLRSRETAYRLYQRAGDPVGAARMAMWLATDCEDFRGDIAVARGWRRRARRLLQDVPVTPEHGWLPILEAEAALLFDEDTAAARRLASEAAAVAGSCKDRDLEILALAMTGLALVSEGEIDDGMQCLDEAAASVLGGELVDEGWANKVLCYLIFACERVRDFERAAQWCERMREVADRMQLTFAQGICRAHYASVLISCGKWNDAETALSEAAALLEASRPPWAAEAFVRLGDLRRRQGRLAEAAELLRRVEWHPAAALALAEVALDAGRLQDGEELIERFLRHVPPENRMQRAAALELRIRISALLGKQERAAEALAELEAVADAVSTLPLRGAACFSAATVEIAAQRLESAKTLLEDAVDFFTRSGTPYEAARARLELAGVLAALGRAGRARAEAGAALHELTQLGSAFSARRAEALLAELGGGAEPSAGNGRAALTRRQREILRLVAEGQSDREVAAALGVSEHTVHRHMANILLRLDASTRAAAASKAVRLGLI